MIWTIFRYIIIVLAMIIMVYGGTFLAYLAWDVLFGKDRHDEWPH